MIENTFNTEKIRAAIAADTDTHNSQWQRLLNLCYNEWQMAERKTGNTRTWMNGRRPRLTARWSNSSS